MGDRETIQLKDVQDMERYLAHDCYCPGEIYRPDGFFFQNFKPEDECKVVCETEKGHVLMVNFDNDRPDLIFVWHDDEENPGRIVDTVIVDATENNVKLLTALAKNENTEYMFVDEFEKGATAKQLKELFSIADAVMIS